MGMSSDALMAVPIDNGDEERLDGLEGAADGYDWTPEPEPDDASDGAGHHRKGDDWLTCSVDRFVDYWIAGWESGAIARPTCTR